MKLLVSAAALSALAAGCASEAPAQSATQHLSTAQCDAFARDGRITICHATGSARNPVVVMRVAEAACINAHSDHPGDYVAVDGNCGPDACLPQTAPCDSTLRCCDGLTCNAGTCVNIDACAAPANACGTNATCTDLPAPAPGDASGRTCACDAGYEGDGITCRDINACANPANACDPNATCADLAAPAPGSASGRTCACNAGFAGDGETCADIDECATGADNCSDSATCTNTPGSFTCACNAGYSGDGVTCADVDECAAGTDNCSDNATCSNTQGSFTCACNAGYSGGGVTCTDVNECAMNNGGCSGNATCSNTAGGRTCACNAGYSGDGLTCTGAAVSACPATEPPHTGPIGCVNGRCPILLLADVDTAGTAALRNSLTAAGHTVTTVAPEYTWTGLNPGLYNADGSRRFQAVIHLDGSTYSAPLAPAAQCALERYVLSGGAFIAGQWDGYEARVGQQVHMPNLILLGHGFTDNCGGCSMTWNTVSTLMSHPVLAGVPASFSFLADGHDATATASFATQPVSVLMRSQSGGPAVSVRDFGTGRVVFFSIAPNYSGTNTLQNANILRLYGNGVLWGSHTVN